ncbi:hypothetical protein CASFOL_022037 [Castilleja foliolosa]|uniref:F-box/LRR-repeat protein 15/At3g58940/PEG3-like LRR domain-containing protein n=1 Tax=Castilleja foliolosa TaxID=1961234 RepID=A0ABD3CZ44_9LAMI
MLKNLLTLSLHEVEITDEIFEKIISSCPLIENLDLLNYTGLKSIKLSKHYNIKNFGCTGNEEIIVEIENPQTLESFRIQNYRDWFLHHKNMHFPHLKSLNLYKVHLPADIFDNFSSFFPCLNELILNFCDGLKEFLLQQCDLTKLKSTFNIILNNLQTLRLHFVYITDEIFDKIISGCPLIENLDLTWCYFLKSIKLRKHCNIKKFSYIDTLESVYINCRDWFCHRNTHFPHLKSLKLYSVQLPAETFDNFSSFFPCLNELELDSCHGLKEFRLFSSSIKCLTMNMYSINTGKMIKAFIDTPNIRYFEYSGQGFLPSIKFTTTSNEWKSQISLGYKREHSDNDATSWFLKLHKLLQALSQSHISLSLDPNEYKKLHINDSYGSFFKPVVVEHLNFKYSSESSILNCFFRISRPRYIHMDLYDDGMYRDEPKLNNLAVFMSKLIPSEIGCYFWLKDLEEVGIDVREEAKEWKSVKGTSLLALPLQQGIRFRLKWRDQLSKFT